MFEEIVQNEFYSKTNIHYTVFINLYFCMIIVKNNTYNQLCNIKNKNFKYGNICY